jgi:hypothetical protein
MKRVYETALVIDLYSDSYSQQFYKVKSQKSGFYETRMEVEKVST